MEKFEGGWSKLRGWMFDLLVTIGQVDRFLAMDLKRMLKEERDEDYVPAADGDLDGELYQKYKSELYGILCSLTEGEAKNVIKGISDVFGDSESSGDGYKALVMLNRRFDSKTFTSLLESCLDVLAPNKIFKRQMR